MSKILVAYFSASGVTAEKAHLIAEASQGDLYEIKPAIPYTEADLDFKNQNSRSTVEMKTPGARPELADKDANVAEYDIIFVGYPIWWYTCPTIINSFLESYDFSGKTIIPFATSDGSRLGKSIQSIKDSVSDTAVVKEGKMVTGTQAYGIQGWINDFIL